MTAVARSPGRLDITVLDVTALDVTALDVTALDVTARVADALPHGDSELPEYGGADVLRAEHLRMPLHGHQEPGTGTAADAARSPMR